MVEPLTMGALITAALGAGAAAVGKGALGQAGKDAYEALKTKLMHWAGRDVAALETEPTSEVSRRAIAKAIDERGDDDRNQLANLAEALLRELRKEVNRHGPIGVQIGELQALEVQLGEIKTRAGIGLKIDRATTSGTFRIDKIDTGEGDPGKS
jgi:hypothetical protein